jgi:hypothetical protein
MFGNEFHRDKNGKLHCTNGPAIIWFDGSYSWFINGKRYTDSYAYQRDANLSYMELLNITKKFGYIQ